MQDPTQLGRAAEDERPMSETSVRAGGAVPVPEPGLTPAVMIARARALIPMLRGQQDEAEARGRYGEDVHHAFLQAGFSRILQPRRFGGYELDLVTFLKAMVAISTGDPGSGWCLGLSSSHGWVVASHFPEDVQAEMFGPDGDFRAPHSLAPHGRAVPVEGGYRLSGTWPYASGVPYATWALSGAAVPASDGGRPRLVFCAVPRSELTVLDDWGGGRLLGMQSSGSNSYVVDGAFVPERFVLPQAVLFDPMPTTPGFELHCNPMYLCRVSGPYHASLVVTAVGAARAALDEFREIVVVKATHLPPLVPRYQCHDDQRAYGQATAMTDAAETILYGFGEQYMEAVERWAATGTPFGREQDARWWAMLQQAGGLAAGAVEVLAHRSTSSHTGRGTRLGRYLRDVTMYRQHIASQRTDVAVRAAAYYLGAAERFLF
jgi:3-hydroxy-9,10-secoandrosta-1,3,5(10)-triene-9,17-dione monooxygenase